MMSERIAGIKDFKTFPYVCGSKMSNNSLYVRIKYNSSACGDHQLNQSLDVEINDLKSAGHNYM